MRALTTIVPRGKISKASPRWPSGSSSQHLPPRRGQHIGGQPFQRVAGVQQQSGAGLATVFGAKGHAEVGLALEGSSKRSACPMRYRSTHTGAGELVPLVRFERTTY